MKKICIVTSGHPPFDERIFWKFGLSLKESGYDVSIICSVINISKEENGILLKGFNSENISKTEKINKLKSLLTESQPDYILCCEPLTVISAKKYKKESNNHCRIISDITEWYPENVAFKFKGFKKFLSYFLLYLFNAYTANISDALIIGEQGKMSRYSLIAPFRKKTIIGYYPVLKYFNYSLRVIKNELVLCYAGLISLNRGIIRLMESAEKLAALHPELNIKVKLVGRFETKRDEEEILKYADKIKSVKVEYAGWTSYDKISDFLDDVHLCFDLRIKNFIYKNSLPIKIFEYMASGKPFIYSDIMPIRKEFNYEMCGQLVNPYDTAEIVHAIEKYLKDRNLITIHSVNGRRVIEQGRNWEAESKKLVSFINGL